MSSRKIGLWFVILLSMSAGKQSRNSLLLESIYDDLRLYINFFQSSIKLIAKVRTEPVCARKGVEVNGLAIRLSSGMIQPRHLTSVYLNEKTFQWQPKRGS